MENYACHVKQKKTKKTEANSTDGHYGQSWQKCVGIRKFVTIIGTEQ